jgi:hypothetical protein
VNAADVENELARLQQMTVPELRDRHAELFGEPAKSYHRQFLIRQIAWRVQAAVYGGLPEEVKQYALAIARDAKLRVRITENAARRKRGIPLDRTVASTDSSDHDSRLPMPGSLVIKEFKGETYVVKVLDDGFECGDRKYRSLSAIAQEITGTKWNGYTFFGLNRGNQNAK